MEKEIKAAGADWTQTERILWMVKEAFILGCLDMVKKMLTREIIALFYLAHI